MQQLSLVTVGLCKAGGTMAWFDFLSLLEICLAREGVPLKGSPADAGQLL